jgi:D-alanyl-D-alanine carboxypeptidase
MTRTGRTARAVVILLGLSFVAVIAGMPPPAAAAPGRAAIVVDMRDGSTLYESRADARQQPASLTKMMTLYMTFEALRDGRLGLDQRVPVSRHAAGMPASKVGFRVGERVSVRHLIRAAAIRSGNDAAVVLAEAIGGTESRFAEMMTARARLLGMRATTFRNASGLTAPGHLSTPRDMALLARHLHYDFPQYWNIFGREDTVAFGRRINNTNRLLRSYRGADGIKTGYTRAAGFNLAASAERNGRHVVAVLFGGRSSAARNRDVARLLDIGFERSPLRVAELPPGQVSSPMPVPNPRRSREPVLVAGLRQVGEALAPNAAHAAVPEPETLPPSATAGMPRSVMPEPAPNREPEPGWSIELGAFAARELAVATLASAAFGDVPGLSQAGREIAVLAGTEPDTRYTARFTGLDGVSALTACAVLSVEGQPCTPYPPEQGGP